MPRPESSPDSFRTVDHVVLPSLPEQTTDATGPHLPPPPDDAPSIPHHVITGEIAKGGMGRVYAGHDLVLDREVAIKTLLLGADPERFVTEAKITARLPHPNIPPVYALGTLADKTPWLVMKLIRGETLAKLLAKGGSDRPDLPRLVQIFEQIAQAVGFAHSRRIIHRDLKPQNVMVGEFGEVQVMDWGLAKERNDLAGQIKDSPPQSLRLQPGDAAGGIHHTTAGAIMGTPGYMAPEQACGKVVDARADVFALGSILAALLTGKPAFVGKTVLEIIQKTAEAELGDVHERLASCGADTELIKLAVRCLAAEPEARPANGQEVAADVAAYRAGVEARLQQAETDRARAETQAAEQRKRRRVMQWAGGLIGGVLLAGIAGTTVGLFQAWKNEQRAKTETGRANKELHLKEQALVELSAEQIKTKAELNARIAADGRTYTALATLTDSPVLGGLTRNPNRTPQEKAFLKHIIRLHQISAASLTSEEGRYMVAYGRMKVAEIHQGLGDMAEAEAENLRAIEELRALAKLNPGALKYRLSEASADQQRGELLSKTNRRQEAELRMRAARDNYADLVRKHPDDLMVAIRHARAASRLASHLLDSGQLDKAKAEFDATLMRFLTLTRRALAANTTGLFPEICGGLIETASEVAALHQKANRYDLARETLGMATNASEMLLKFDSTQPQYLGAAADIHINLANLNQVTGKLDEAEKLYLKAEQFYDRILATYPGNVSYRKKAAQLNQNLGMLYRARRKYKQAERPLRASADSLDRLAAEQPSRSDLQHLAALGHGNLSLLYEFSGQLPDAVREATLAAERLRQLTKAQPSVPRYNTDLGMTLGNLGNYASRQGKPQDAAKFREEALLALRKAFQATPKDPFVAGAHISNLEVLIQLQLSQGRHAGVVDLITERFKAGSPQMPVLNTQTASVLGWTAVVIESDKTLTREAKAALVKSTTGLALDHLKKAADGGFGNIKYLDGNNNFRLLREMPAFKELEGRIRRNALRSPGGSP